MVTRESAIHSTANKKMCHEMSITGDHSTIVKFDSRSDQNYLHIRRHLLQLTKDAPEIVKARFGKGMYSRGFLGHRYA